MSATVAEMERDEIIRELYGWIVTELDPEPGPVAEYLSDPHLGALADEIIGVDAQPGAKPPGEDKGPS